MESQAKQVDFQGVYPAIATPFSSDGLKVDYRSLERLVAHQLSAGVNGIVVCGSTGEAATLTEPEYYEVVEFVANRTKGRAQCIAGINRTGTAQAVDTAKRLEEFGLDGLLLVTPPYNKPTQEGLYRHFSEVRMATATPIIAYNVPGRTAVNLLPKTVEKLAADGVITALKESSGSLDQMLDILSATKGALALLAGDDSFCFPLMVCGGKGVVSVCANVVPSLYARMVEATNKQDFAAAKRIHFDLIPLVRALFTESNPIPLKSALAMIGLIESSMVRLPLMVAKPDTQLVLRSALEGLGVCKPT